MSHQFVQNEIEQNRNMGLFAPSIFLGVSAFLINVVMSRTINSQREQIAALKAFGYSNLEVGWHYIKCVLLIVGGVAGDRHSRRGVVRLAGDGHVRPAVSLPGVPVPHLPFACSWRRRASAPAAAVLGAIGSVLRAVRLPPAEAMRPATPAGLRADDSRAAGPRATSCRRSR